MCTALSALQLVGRSVAVAQELSQTQEALPLVVSRQWSFHNMRQLLCPQRMSSHCVYSVCRHAVLHWHNCVILPACKWLVA